VLVEHLGKSPGILDTRAPKQVKSKQYLPQHRNGVLEKLDDKDGLSICPLLNCETAVAALGFLLRHTCKYTGEIMRHTLARESRIRIHGIVRSRATTG